MQHSNFSFLQQHNEPLSELGRLAEVLLSVDAGAAQIRIRSFAEEVVKAIYQYEKLPRPSQFAGFKELLDNYAFQSAVDNSLRLQLDLLRQAGNRSAHSGKGFQGNAKIALESLKVAHQIALYMGVRYYELPYSSLPVFREPCNQTPENHRLSAIEKQLAEKQAELEKITAELESKRLENEKNLPMPTEAGLAARQLESQHTANMLHWNEAETRKKLIDVLLLEAGWDINDPSQVSLEYPLTDFEPNKSGKGAVDYVLWGTDGKPLAVIEAKRTAKDANIGREQARLYADNLTQKFGQRPIIFCSNGFKTLIWNDKKYPSYREVFGFYRQSSLERLFSQQAYERDLTANIPDKNHQIAGRPYQEAAVKAVAEAFQQKKRKALIVQATGTGKTRVAIAIVNLLLTNKWAKNVLFLCDRRELVNQAIEAFTEHLPSEPRCIVGENNQLSAESRIFVATYPAMMNRFAQLDIGFFDLIIADESHRSIYNKYRDLFDYFDCLQLGLTATPVGFINRDTYAMFGCDKGNPTFSFDLASALSHNPPYLVPFKVKEISTKFLREGIKYHQLSESQQRQLEDDLGEEAAKLAEFEGNQIGRKIFSVDTDRTIIRTLMEQGIKPETAAIGKTIIFAQTQKHAEQLHSVFNELYPQYGSTMCKVIHTAIPQAEHLLKEFKKADNPFCIAISVDMLDTGIDVPEVVNLVFAKRVQSFVKFWQMIGRGTRLCKNLFGEGKDKDEFLILDFYGNFHYFDQEYQEAENAPQAKSLLRQLFEARLELANQAVKNGDFFAKDLATNWLKADIADLPTDSVSVRRELEMITKLKEIPTLLAEFQPQTLHSLQSVIAPLMDYRVESDPKALRFDRLVTEAQSHLVQKSSQFEDDKARIQQWVEKLPINIKAVAAKQPWIEAALGGEFWQNVSVQTLEEMRLALRDVMQFMQKEIPPTLGGNTTRTQDGDIRETEGTYAPFPDFGFEQRALKAALAELGHHPAMQKIRQNQAVSEAEIRSLISQILVERPNLDSNSLQDFYGKTFEDFTALLKQMAGLDIEAIQQHFAHFIQTHSAVLSSRQMQFLDLLQSYIAMNGGLTRATLYDAPFSHFSHDGLDGVFPNEQVADEIFQLIEPYLVG